MDVHYIGDSHYSEMIRKYTPLTYILSMGVGIVKYVVNIYQIRNSNMWGHKLILPCGIFIIGCSYRMDTDSYDKGVRIIVGHHVSRVSNCNMEVLIPKTEPIGRIPDTGYLGEFPHGDSICSSCEYYNC